MTHDKCNGSSSEELLTKLLIMKNKVKRRSARGRGLTVIAMDDIMFYQWNNVHSNMCLTCDQFEFINTWECKKEKINS